MVGGLQEWQRATDCRTNIAPAQAALPSPNLPQIPGVSPHIHVGVRVAEEVKKEPEAAAAEPREPFYCTAKQGMSPSSVPRSREATPELSPTQQAGPQGRGKWGPGARKEPHHIPSAPLTGPAARAKSQTAQTGWMRQQRPHAVSEDCAQLSRAFLLPMEHSSLHPAFKESLFQELTEPRVNFDPSGKQRKGCQEEAVDVGRQQQAGGPGQHGHASAPGTATPAQTGPVLSPPLQKGVPSSERPGHISAGPHCLTSVPARVPPGPPSLAGTWRGPCGSPFPPPAGKGTRYSPMWAYTEPGDSLSLSPGGAQAAWTRRAGTHLIAIVHDHQVPQAQGSEELEHPWQRCLLQGRTGLGGCSIPSQPPRPTLIPRELCRAVPGHYLGHSVGRGVHELAEVDHALALVLGDVNGLDGGEAGVGIPKILQLQPPLHQAQVGPFHKNLGRKEMVGDQPAELTDTKAMHKAREGKGQKCRTDGPICRSTACFPFTQGLRAQWGAG